MKELDWIVNLLINLHSFCESNGLTTLSDKVADAIEEAAPLIRGNRIDRDKGHEAHTMARSPIQTPVDGAPRGPGAHCGPRLIYDAVAGTKL